MISTMQRHPGHTMPETAEVVRVSNDYYYCCCNY